LAASGFAGLGFAAAGFAASGVVASVAAGVWADAGNPVVIARPADNASDKLIDKAVDRKAAARVDLITAFLRDESSIGPCLV